MTMGEKMQKLRKQKNWSQETLAEKLGVSYQTFLRRAKEHGVCSAS